MDKQKSVFDELNAVNVQEYVKQKAGGGKPLNYLSWSYAMAEALKRYPEMQYDIRHWDGKPYLEDPVLGYMVETSVTIQGITRTMWLPVMDGAHNAMKPEPYTYQVKNPNFKYAKWDATKQGFFDQYGKKHEEFITKQVDAATMFDINTAIMRCLVKNLAMFGLGMYIYNGEDLPEDERNADNSDNPESPANEKLHLIEMVGKADSVDDLTMLWETFTEYQTDPQVSRAFTSRKKLIQSAKK